MKLSNLSLEEREQLSALGSWWAQWGGTVLVVITAMLLAVAGWNGWRWYERSQNTGASATYDELMRAAASGDARGVRDQAGTLIEKFPRTSFASLGALSAARFLYDRKDFQNAKAQLGWVAEKSRSEDFRDLARLRLAAILADEKKFDEALNLLEAKHGVPWASHYALMRGDVLFAAGRNDEAKKVYAALLGRLQPKEEALREGVQLRIDALGG